MRGGREIVGKGTKPTTGRRKTPAPRGGGFDRLKHRKRSLSLSKETLEKALVAVVASTSSATTNDDLTVSKL